MSVFSLLAKIRKLRANNLESSLHLVFKISKNEILEKFWKKFQKFIDDKQIIQENLKELKRSFVVWLQNNSIFHA